MKLWEICCDCCPYTPTCEEENDFLQDIGLADEERGEASERPGLLGQHPAVEEL